MQDSYFEFKINGRSNFTNVRLFEFYTFELQGNRYLLQVEQLVPNEISEETFHLVSKIASTFGGSACISGAELHELQSLSLVSNTPIKHSPELRQSSPSQTPHLIPRPTVGSISIFVAQKCNMRCVYCYGGDGEYGNKGLMSSQVALKTVDWLISNSGDLPSVHIGFFGGEPLVNFRIIREVVHYAKAQVKKNGKRVTFGLITNGVLLSEERIVFLRDNEISVTVSFDGPPEIQNTQRPLSNGGDSYDKIVSNVHKLSEYFSAASARATISGDTDIEVVRAGLIRAGFTNYQLMRVSEVALSTKETTDTENSRSTRVERMLATEKILADELLKIIKARELGEVSPNGMVGYFLLRLISPVRHHYYCGAGRGVFAIGSSGDIYPCHRFVGLSEFKLGNIATYQVGKVNRFHGRRVDGLIECSSCWARYACGGCCYYNNQVRRGDTHLPDRDSCRELRSLIEIATVLYFQLNEEDRQYFSAAQLSRSLTDIKDVV